MIQSLYRKTRHADPLQDEVARVSHTVWAPVKSIPPLNRPVQQENVRKMGVKGKGAEVSPEYWTQLDIQLAEAVKTVAQRLKASPDRPRRITKSLIAAELHEAGRLYHQLDKLPLTAQALAEAVETPEAAGIRKLLWEAERFRQAKKIPNRTQLIQKAGVDHLANKSPVKQAIDTMLAQLQQLEALAIESVLA